MSSPSVSYWCSETWTLKGIMSKTWHRQAYKMKWLCTESKMTWGDKGSNGRFPEHSPTLECLLSFHVLRDPLPSFDMWFKEKVLSKRDAQVRWCGSRRTVWGPLHFCLPQTDFYIRATAAHLHRVSITHTHAVTLRVSFILTLKKENLFFLIWS